MALPAGQSGGKSVPLQKRSVPGEYWKTGCVQGPEQFRIRGIFGRDLMFFRKNYPRRRFQTTIPMIRTSAPTGAYWSGADWVGC